MRRFILGCAMAVVAAGCGEGGLFSGHVDDSGKRVPRRTVTPPELATTARLTQFTGASACTDLEQSIEDAAVNRMTYLVDQSRESSHAWADWARNGEDYSYADAGASASGAGGGAGNSAPNAYTTTNTQVAGIDESDFVKNDGTRIFVLSGGTLRAVRSWPANTIATAGSLSIAGTPKEMFLEGDRVLVYSVLTDGVSQTGWCDGAGDQWCQHYYADYYATATQATLVDVSDLNNLRAIAHWRLPGRFHTARKVGSRVLTVLNAPRYSDYVGSSWISPFHGDQPMSSNEIDARYDTLIAQKEAVIRGRTLTDWLSTGSFTAEDGTVTDEVLDCARVHVPNGSTQAGSSNIVSFDLATPGPADRVSVFARSDEIYMSFDALYLTQRHAWWSWSSTTQSATYVHKFSLSNPAAPSYEASGVVFGHIADQFSMDELNGYLRLAVTESVGWGNTTNRVVVLQPNGDQLVTVGKTAALAPGERIMSARFIGEKGYVVTFRQVDPLYTLDLSNPAAPTVIGELKIPGFSSYIHPLDANHLLTIGSYIPENGAWNERAVQLAIFDVSNMANPMQKFVKLVGTAYSSSSAQQDHRAFNYFPERKVLAIPFVDWGSNGYTFTSDLRLYKVDTATGFETLGALGVDDVLVRGCDVSNGCWSWWWEPKVRRSVMADDYVYAVTTGGVKVSRIATPYTPVATALFPYSP